MTPYWDDSAEARMRMELEVTAVLDQFSPRVRLAKDLRRRCQGPSLLTSWLSRCPQQSLEAWVVS